MRIKPRTAKVRARVAKLNRESSRLGKLLQKASEPGANPRFLLEVQKDQIRLTHQYYVNVILKNWDAGRDGFQFTGIIKTCQCENYGPVLEHQAECPLRQ